MTDNPEPGHCSACAHWGDDGSASAYCLSPRMAPAGDGPPIGGARAGSLFVLTHRDFGCVHYEARVSEVPETESGEAEI